eukprot:03731.XXX_112736_112463_1 [CDS] Oithona nana genome sequencing.
MKKHQEVVKSQQKRDMIYICDICQTSFFTVLCALYLHKETSHVTKVTKMIKMTKTIKMNEMIKGLIKEVIKSQEVIQD